MKKFLIILLSSLMFLNDSYAARSNIDYASENGAFKLLNNTFPEVLKKSSYTISFCPDSTCIEFHSKKDSDLFHLQLSIYIMKVIIMILMAGEKK